MVVSFCALRNKEIINMKTGLKIGFADDLEFDTESGKIVSVIVYGKPRALGLMGRDDDMVIKCRDIKLVGEDTILVDFDESAVYTKSRTYTVENLLK